MMATNRTEAPRRIVDETRRLYSNVLSRPLSERQLARPSFSFIETVVKSLITETRILRNTFNANDFETAKRQLDKRAKVDFVQRLIDFVANHKQPIVGCVAAKLVAGIDPIKTNELLQALARIAQAKLNGQDALPGRSRTFTKQLQQPQQQQQQQHQSKQAANLANQPSSASSGTGSDRRRSGLGSASGPSSINSIKGLESAKNKKSSDPDVKMQLNDPLKTTSHHKSPKSEVSRPKIEPKQVQRPIEFERQVDINKNQRAQAVSVVSENDINKNLQNLRTNLKILRKTLIDVGQMEDSLRSKLNNLLNSMRNQ